MKALDLLHQGRQRVLVYQNLLLKSLFKVSFVLIKCSIGESDDNDDTLSMMSENTKNRKKKKKIDEKKQKAVRKDDKSKPEACCLVF